MQVMYSLHCQRLSLPVSCLRRAATATAGRQSGPNHVQKMFEDLKQEFGYMGNVDHKKIGALDLYRIFQAAKTPTDFRVGLQAMNLF